MDSRAQQQLFYPRNGCLTVMLSDVTSVPGQRWNMLNREFT